MDNLQLNIDVTKFLDNLNHPLREEIEYLRKLILSTDIGLTEGIKWKGPSYSIDNEDRITIKINPPKLIQVIFHRGAKVIEQPKERLLGNEYSIISWRENDRGITTFKNLEELEKNQEMLKEIVVKWIKATI